MQHRVFQAHEHSKTLSVLDAQQPHPVNYLNLDSVTYFNKGKDEEINMDRLTGYA